MVKELIQVGKAVCASVIFALIYSLVFAGVAVAVGAQSSAIKTVNQVFKILA